MIYIKIDNDVFYDDAVVLVRSFYPRTEVMALKADSKPEEKDEILSIEVPDVTGLDKKNAHEVFKDSLYKKLSEKTGKKLPWGYLTGVRPSKIAYTMLEEGATKEQIKKHFMDKHYASEEKAELALTVSDIHITVGMPLMYRINGRLQNAPTNPSDGEIIAMLAELLTDEQRENLERGIDADFAIRTPDGNRQRVNVFKQDGKMAATIRLLNSSIPSMEMLGLPSVLRELADKPRGMILVTGPTGSGKSTTLASMIDYINANRPEHIITIEDPVEYVYDRKMALIHQREVGRDVTNFASALRSALREDPDIILVGEMRDYETISAALTAAETGHLVMSTLHTTGAAQTIDRIIDACPAGMQNQVRTQLASVLNGVITQCLIPNARGNGRVVATEILVGTDAVCNQIRENKCHQLGSLMQSGSSVGMHTLNGDLSRLVQNGMINRQMAYKYSNDVAELDQYL